jgi:hypothetical protein
MLTKTPKGTDVLHTRSINLPTKQRTLLLLANGARSNEDLLKQTAGLSATVMDLDALLALGLLEDLQPAFANSIPMPAQIEPPAAAINSELADLRKAAFQIRDQASPVNSSNTVSTPLSSNRQTNMGAATMPMSTVMEASARPLTEAEKFEQAYRTATKLSSELGLRAFRLQLSLERASNLDEIRDLRPKLLEALVKESGEADGLKRIKPLDRLLRQQST